MATMRDVAELSGVSITTVSRYINNNGYVSKESQEKIQIALNTLDYQPNELARALYHKEPKIIGLLIPDIMNPYFADMTRGVEEVAAKHNYAVIIGNCFNASAKKRYTQMFRQYNVSNVLNATGSINKTEDFSQIHLDRISEDSEFACYSNDYLGGHIAAQEILRRPHDKIIVIAGPQDLSTARKRLKGSLEVLIEMEVDYQVVPIRSFEIPDAEDLAQSFFDTYPQVDSIIAPTDIIAMSLIKEAKKLGIKIPDELQIIGYDNSYLAQFTLPGLTTIEQFGYKVGFHGAEMLFQRIKQETINQKHLMINPELVERETLREMIIE